jgi:hypothetical protein
MSSTKPSWKSQKIEAQELHLNFWNDDENGSFKTITSWDDFKDMFWGAKQEFDKDKVMPALQTIVYRPMQRRIPTLTEVNSAMIKVLALLLEPAEPDSESKGSNTGSESDSSTGTIIRLNPSNTSGDEEEEKPESGSARFSASSVRSTSGHASQITN